MGNFQLKLTNVIVHDFCYYAETGCNIWLWPSSAWGVSQGVTSSYITLHKQAYIKSGFAESIECFDYSFDVQIASVFLASSFSFLLLKFFLFRPPLILGYVSASKEEYKRISPFGQFFILVWRYPDSFGFGSFSNMYTLSSSRPFSHW